MTMIVGQDKPSLEELAHHGVKGMHWGVRKERDSGVKSFNDNKVVMRRDGSIDIEKGASIQRLVRSSGKSKPMQDYTYASINAYDNARYIKTIGGRLGGRDQILSIKTMRPIKAPSVDDAVRINTALMLKDSKYADALNGPYAKKLGAKQLEKIRADPIGKEAQSYYWQANVMLAFGAEFEPNAPYVQKSLQTAVEKAGYNALRDENDVTAHLSKSPIIVFSPEKNLKVVTVTDITKELRKANKQQLKRYKGQGKAWIDKELYGQG